MPLIIGFLGVLVVLRPAPGNISLWHLLAFISAMMAALSMVATRLLVYTESNTTVVFYYYVFAAVGSLPLAVTSFHGAPWHIWIALATSGFCLYLAMCCYTISFRYAKLSIISPINFFGVGFAGFWGWLFWNQIPAIWTYLGMLMVLVGAIIILKQEGPETPVSTTPVG